MLLYDAQRECDAYVRSPEMRPLIRQYIQKAIENICNANTPGKDWSFLLKKIDLTRDNASTDTLLIFNSPANLRALVEVLDLGGVDFNTLIGENYAYTIEWSSRTLTISRSSDSPAFPSGTLAVKAYIAHPTILVADTQHANPTWDTPWTPTWPAADAVWLPDEFFPLLVDTTLLELKRHEIEVAFTVQELEQSINQKLEEARVNYALQVYPLNAPATPDVKWLLAVGKYELGTERYKDRIVAFINEIADELSDVIKVPINSRPAPITETSSALPTISGVSVPAEFWLAGMRFKAKSVAGNIDQLTVDRWLNAKTEWAEEFNCHHYDPNPSTLTVQWLATVGEKYLGGERFGKQVLAFINEVAGELADIAYVPIASRPTTISAIAAAALPTIDGVSVPAEYWSAGVVYKCASFNKTADQLIIDRWEKAKADWKSNYIETAFLVNPAATPTVDWLLNVGQKILGGDRFANQVLAFVNETVNELADIAKVSPALRPTAITSSSGNLPIIDSVAVPTDIWSAGMVYKAATHNKTADQAIVDRWQKAREDWQNIYIEQAFTTTAPSTPTATWATEVIKKILGGERYADQALELVNEVVGELAEVAKVSPSLRPAAITSASGSLPQIDSITVPPSIWVAGFVYKATAHNKTIDAPIAERWEKAKAEWQSAYVEAAFIVNAPSSPTVQWLVEVGKKIAGGERYENQILSYVNVLAEEFADIAKVPITSRPTAITTVSSATLPQIDGYSVPASYWAAGMVYMASNLTGTLNQGWIDRWNNAKAEWQSNYVEANFAVSPPTTPTVDWLVAVGEKIMGGERFETQALAFVNEVASDLADMIKLDLASRPTAILTVSNAALPTFNSIACPAEFWAAGMVYKASFLIGKGTQDIYARWEKAKGDWSTSFYALNVQQQGFSLSTFGGLVDYIRRVWKTCRNEMQAWDIANEVVADIMERVNSESLMQTQTITATEGTKEYTLADDFKCAVKVTVQGHEIPGRGFTERGPAVRNINEYTGLCPSPQAFRIAGGKLLLDFPVKAGLSIVVYYYPYHTWTTTPSTAVPVKTSTVMKGVRAQVALVEKDTATASYWTQKYEEAIRQYDANQINNYPADNRIINATPSVNRRILRAFK